MRRFLLKVWKHRTPQLRIFFGSISDCLFWSCFFSICHMFLFSYICHVAILGCSSFPNLQWFGGKDHTISQASNKPVLGEQKSEKTGLTTSIFAQEAGSFSTPVPWWKPMWSSELLNLTSFQVVFFVWKRLVGWVQIFGNHRSLDLLCWKVLMISNCSDGWGHT